jgi:DNA-binding NarL/FixJ family response regulator
VVDDYPPFRQFVRSTVGKTPQLQVVGEVSDGLESIQKAQKLQPDLILLDIGLPTLNGIEAARRIRELCPRSKILFVSESRSWAIAEEALRSGGSGYVVKSDAANELLRAMEWVLLGNRFISTSLARHDLTGVTEAHPGNYPGHPGQNPAGTSIPLNNMELARHHEAGFYCDDRWFLEDATQFIGTALKAGNGAIVAATEPHRNRLLAKLDEFGVDVGLAIAQGRYIAMDAGEALLVFMIDGMPEPVRFMAAFDDLIERASKAAKGENHRVAIFGECTQLLCAQGNAEAAIQMEKLGNQLVQRHDVDILCGYSQHGFDEIMDNPIYQRIRAEHSAVYSR